MLTVVLIPGLDVMSSLTLLQMFMDGERWPKVPLDLYI